MPSVKTKNSLTTTNVPANSSLLQGELAVNITDQKLWVGDGSGDPVIIADFNSGGSSVTMSTTAPSSPASGDLWFDTEDGLLNVWYEDGTSDQWVSTAANGSQYPIDSLADVTITSPTTGDLLRWSGSAWVNDTNISDIVLKTDVDDTSVNGATTVPISSNWAYDHENDTTHPYTDTAKEWTKAQNFNATALTDGATINWDAESNQVTLVTLGGNRTMAAPTNQIDGGVYQLGILQDGTGSRTITWNSAFKFAGGTAPTLSQGANAIDVITFRSNGSSMFEVGRSLNIS